MDALSIMKACPLSTQIFLMSTGPSTVHCWYCLSSQILLMCSPAIVPSTGQVSWSLLGLSFIWFGAVICNCPPDIPSSVQVHMSMLMSDMASSNKTIDTTTFIHMWTTFSNSGSLGTIENLSNCNGNTNTNYTQKTNFTFLKLLPIAIMPTSSICIIWPNYLGAESVRTVENGKFTVIRSPSPENFEFGHFTLLFCRGREKRCTKM